MLALHISGLSDFALTSDEQLNADVNLACLQSLLTYLVLHNTAPLTRRQLAFLLWPDSTEGQAQQVTKSPHFLPRTLPTQWLPSFQYHQLPP
jgi:DNA-binding PucR family transcriptional regulator